LGHKGLVELTALAGRRAPIAAADHGQARRAGLRRTSSVSTVYTHRLRHARSGGVPELMRSHGGAMARMTCLFRRI
jgi:hypothetical protein